MTKTEAANLLKLSLPTSEKEVVAAYRKAAMRHHPDREGGTTEAFKLCGEARDRLSSRGDPFHGGRDGSGSDPFGSSEFWNSYNSAFDRKHRPRSSTNRAEFKYRGSQDYVRQRKRGDDILADVPVSVLDRTKGCSVLVHDKDIKVSVPEWSKLGTVLRIKGRGEKLLDPGSISGDLLLTLVHAPDSYYQETLDHGIAILAYVDFQTWTMGGHVDVALPDGMFSLSVPALMPPEKKLLIPETKLRDPIFVHILLSPLERPNGKKSYNLDPQAQALMDRLNRVASISHHFATETQEVFSKFS